MKNFICCLWAFLLVGYLIGQNQNNNWFFGKGLGIEFTSNEPILKNNFDHSAGESVASVSNKYGETIFYATGGNIYNRNGKLKFRLQDVNSSNSAQGNIILPKPCSCDSTFLIFTVDAFTAKSEELRFGEINVSCGGEISGGLTTQLFEGTAEKIAAASHQNGVDFWIFAPIVNTNKFYTARVSCDGIMPLTNGTFIQEVKEQNYKYDAVHSDYGQMKVSPNNKIVAVAFRTHGVIIYSLNDTNGSLQYLKTIPADPSNSLSGGKEFYGLEFSPNSQYLYVSKWAVKRAGEVAIYDINQGDQIDSQIINTTNVWSGGHLQLGPDDNIYFADQADNYIRVFKNPNTPNLSNFTDLFFDGVVEAGLPPRVPKFERCENCELPCCEEVLNKLDELEALIRELKNNNN